MKRVVVIEREFGAGASVIAGKVAQRLGWKLLDHALTEEIARVAKVHPEVCKLREEKRDSVLYRLAKVFWRGGSERSARFEDDLLDADRLVCLSKDVIEQAANGGQCVIVGRGAAYFLRERTDTFCVFLYAPRDVKFCRVLEQVKDEAKAIELVDTVDLERKEFIRHFFNAEWPGRQFYHAMLNTAAGIDASVDDILNLLDSANKREKPGKA
jgi:Cytidylate kinase-like family